MADFDKSIGAAQRALPADDALDALDTLYDLCRGSGTTSECINSKIALKHAILALAAGEGFGCHCDLEPGMSPDGCVIDEGRPQDCVYARRVKRKEDCSYWRPIALAAAPKAAAAPEGEMPYHTPCLTREHAEWLADKIVALGDYAKEAAEMLRHWPGAALEQERDAARYRWLTEDHADKATRAKRDELLERMFVMSHSAASAAIDAQRLGREKDKPCE